MVRKTTPATTNHEIDITTLWQTNKSGRIFLAQQRKFANIPDLLILQKRWFQEFITVYLNKLFEEINPIQDIAWEKHIITIDEVEVSESLNGVDLCKKKELTYGGIISWRIKLVDSVNQKVMFSKRANIGIMPLMTPNASYIINGVERIVISQIVRSYGVFFSKKDLLHNCKLIPERWPWLEIFIEKSGHVVARINKSRKFSITALLRAFGLESDESIREAFSDTFDDDDTDYISLTLKKDVSSDALSAAEHIYGKLRPGELVDVQNALDYLKAQFLTNDRIHLGNIARRKINAKLWLSKSFDDPGSNVFDTEDLVATLKYLFNIANMKRWYYLDDADHLSNKRIRTMGEILYSHLQPVMRKFVKSVKGKLSVLNTEEQIKLTDLVNFKIVDNAIKSFFATSQLSQFLDQINPLAEIEHKRRITALGPGGLKKDTAKFDVRDLHASHYGRICPIETPEWQNIWLVLYQALYSRVNDEWFVETPALKIYNSCPADAEVLLHKIAKNDIFVLDAKGKETKDAIVQEWHYIDEEKAKLIEKHYKKLWSQIGVYAYFTDVIEYISPEMDERVIIADVTTPVDEYGNILNKRVPARHFDQMELFHVNDITHIDVNPSQIFSANTSLIPFVNHNDAVRAMIATNQHRQGIPLLKSESPFVGTGLESDIVSNTYQILTAEWSGEVIYIDGKRIKIKYWKSGTKEYELDIFKKSNQKTLIHQRPRVSLWQHVKEWDIIAEWSAVDNGEIAVGKNLRVAFMPWEWFNYEDAIVISNRLVKDDTLTSIHIEEYEIEVSETKLGPEETTNDIPWVSLSKLKDLDVDGIVRIGSSVKWWDILVGKITPKSEWELTPEEKLIQAIFWDKSKSLKDTSLYIPSGSEWKVIEVVVLDSKKGDNLLAWVRQKIKVYVAQMRKIEVWDKLAAKHGNKWIISIVVPEEDMPYTTDGQVIDIILNPLGVVSRMNIWQVLETQLGLIAKTLGVKFAIPTFSSFWQEQIKNLAIQAWLPEDLRLSLYDWRTGELYPNRITVWYMHMMKLNHMVVDKIHARSVGPYALITQQPLWGKARDWWQRFWEMEVWALEAYSAVYTLQEMLTIKSDDVIGRNKTYESIIKNQSPKVSGLPESFNYLTYLLKGLCQDISMLNKDQIEQIERERVNRVQELNLSGITGSFLEWEKENDLSDKLEMMETILKDFEESGYTSE